MAQIDPSNKAEEMILAKLAYYYKAKQNHPVNIAKYQTMLELAQDVFGYDYLIFYFNEAEKIYIMESEDGEQLLAFDQKTVDRILAKLA